MTDARSSWWETVPGILTATAGAITAIGGLLLALNQIGLIGGDTPGSAQAPAVSPSTGQAASESAAGTPAADQAAAASTASGSDAGSGPSGGSPPTASATTGAGAYAVEFTSGREVTLRSSRADAVYTILESPVENRNTGKLILRLKVRQTNIGRSDLSFGNGLFRLLIDDVPRAPTNFLNEVVDARSAKEGEVVFELPETARRLVLTIDNGEDSARLPVVLKKSG